MEVRQHWEQLVLSSEHGGNGWLSSHTPSCRCFSADVLKMVDALTWLLLISDPALEVLAHMQVKLALSNLLFPICQATP